MSRELLWAAGLAAAASLSCAARAGWQRDESARIDEAMRCEPFHADLAGARGIAVYSAPPLATPWKEGEGYQLRREESGRKARLGKVQRQPPRARRDVEPLARQP